MISTEKNSIKDNKIDYNKRYRIISKIFISLELLMLLFVNSLIRCACGIPTFNAIPPIIVFIINVIFYFITRNRVDTKKDLKFMIIVYILLLMIFCISLVAIPNRHHTIISLRI